MGQQEGLQRLLELEVVNEFKQMAVIRHSRTVNL